MHPWRLRLERMFTPLARRIPFAPNTITTVALIMNLLAAAALALGSRDSGLFLVAPILLGVGGILDALDGIVARLQGSTTPFGDFLDHFADRISDTTLVAAWTIGASVNHPLAVTTVVLVSLNGYVGTQIEATFRVRDYDGLGRGEFVLALFTLPLAAFTIIRSGLQNWSVLGLSVLEWLTALLAVVALLGIIQRLRNAASLARNQEPADD